MSLRADHHQIYKKLARLREVLAEYESIAECSRVQMNTTTEHQMHKTAPYAQRNEPDDTKSP